MANILVVDDAESMRGVIAAALGREGHVVTQAADGREAGEMIRTNPPDLIITDILMPECDGLELLMNLAREKRSVPVIAITGIPGQSMPYLRIAQSLGAVRTLAKPFTIEQLVNATKDALASHSPE